MKRTNIVLHALMLLLLLQAPQQLLCQKQQRQQKAQQQQQQQREHYLILHPFYAGSHVLTLHSVAEKLVLRGHKVTTVRYREFNDFSTKNIFCKVSKSFSNRFGDQHGLRLKPLGPLHQEIVLRMRNADGRIPFLTAEEEAEFLMPMDLIWTDGLALSTLFSLPGILKKPISLIITRGKMFFHQGNPWNLVDAYCDFLLGPDSGLRSTLESMDERY